MRTNQTHLDGHFEQPPARGLGAVLETAGKRVEDQGLADVPVGVLVDEQRVEVLFERDDVELAVVPRKEVNDPLVDDRVFFPRAVDRREQREHPDGDGLDGLGRFRLVRELGGIEHHPQCAHDTQPERGVRNQGCLAAPATAIHRDSLRRTE
jgi:hypothetical protein